MSTEKDKLLGQYIEALFRGDLDDQMQILESVADDDLLVRELWDTNIAVGEDMSYVAQATEVRNLAEGTLGATVIMQPQDAALFTNERPIDTAPLLVADVAAQLRSEIVRGGARVPDRASALKATELLAQHKEPLPDEALSERGARTLLARWNIQLGRWFDELFHGTAFDLEMGRREDLRLNAARRTRIHQQIRKATSKEISDEK